MHDVHNSTIRLKVQECFHLRRGNEEEREGGVRVRTDTTNDGRGRENKKKRNVRAFDTEMRVLIGHDRREGEESAERCVAFRAWKWTGRKYAEYRQKCDN